jgi:hypothetical protein
MILEGRCPACMAFMRLHPTELAITVPAQDEVAGRCTFTCPTCASEVSFPIDEQQDDLLRRLGAQTSLRDLAMRRHPSMAARMAPARDEPPLTYDDLLDFHQLLQQDDWFEHLLEVAR